MTKSETQSKRKLRARALCQRYDVTGRTIDRWVQAGILPKPMLINHARYWDEDEIDRRDQERKAEVNPPSKTPTCTRTRPHEQTTLP